MKFIELEYKYKADKITVGQFVDFVSNNFDILDVLTARGHDHFFSKEEGSFMRYRIGGGMNDNCELTVKRKNTDKNSWNRLEIDLPLNKRTIDYETVEEFAKFMDYSYVFTLVKLNYVIRTPGVTFAYYVVNNNDHFIEIEVNKGSFTSEDEALDILNRTEKRLGELGITHNNRTKKSLYEMYRGK
jgi:adenylate cyclase class IV